MTNYRSILKQEAAIAREEGKVRFIIDTERPLALARGGYQWQTIKHEIKAKRKLKAVSPSQ